MAVVSSPSGAGGVGKKSAQSAMLLMALLASDVNAFNNLMTVVPRRSGRSMGGIASTNVANNRPHFHLMAQHPHRTDVDVQFGTADTSGTSWGYEEDDMDDADIERIRRKERVNELLAEHEEEIKEERRKKKWGEFSDAKTKEDVKRVEASMKEKINEENSVKKSLANQAGIQFEILAPQESSVYDEDGDIKIIGGSSKKGGQWYNKVDKDLEQEWEELESENEGDVADGQSSKTDTVTVNGKIVARDTLQGVRVGSAGGWELEIFPGDFIVHRKFGIGRFEKTCTRPKSKLTDEEKKAQDKRRGELMAQELKKISGGATPEDIQRVRATFGTEEDDDPISNPQITVLEISYADGIVHVPVDRAYRISRYKAGDTIVKPRLSRVRGDTWKNARRKVEENTLALAQDVLALYATRETLQRQPFDPSREGEVKEFETSFKFEPTPDQQKCFEDVENDMVWRSRPMDRLVCGDVGFGKTEVAMRALFRAILNGRQAAMLAPTGVLAAQHYKNIVKRMGEGTPYNRKICLLRGGMGVKATREMRAGILNGEIELIIGTHAILSKQLEFKDLGLLVIDEEQRFGVKQKERLKLICSGIDVLTLSATPIPRTLQMSLSGIRDTSTIKSPPPMRKPTISYVVDMNDEILQDAVQRELDRNGQCFYVVPRISMIDDAKKTLERLFPDIRIAIAHGRMAKNGAEQSVAEFAEGNHEILLATTVIENGVDIPTVNTIIIQNSQAFGMSTLYQLRGRVGRSDQQAYAYFLYQEETVTEQAAMRLQAIGELNELGSGFDVANRDLEIRGAGSLLGTEQSGMAARVGFDLYMRMLKKSIRQLRGLDLPLVPRTNIMLPGQQGSMEITGKNKKGDIVRVNAYNIPKRYIPDENERVKQETSARLAESTAALVALTNDWKESFGPLPASLQVRLKTLHLHACTRRLGIDLVGMKGNEDGTFDCVLRSPGLRPRHWAAIVPELPRGIAPKGLDVAFPGRLTLSGEDENVAGGKAIDLKELLEDPSLDEDANNWDALDQEEIEAIKEISSAYQIKKFDEVEIEQYPRFIIRDFGKGPKAVDRLLKFLLPLAKVVLDKQENDKDAAKMAAELREKREAIDKQRKAQEYVDAQKLLMAD
eukprot:CAMPEP_0119564576 /NCGR_PEP_ID=MMETSP1352-20130426/27431_1 /TAXON_ID=265584 /ORGANISM="Stauroneis constricta, Strain CCMP1120" /LENGTH=1119 /DNA_ID=CAMNT_0007613347 /DNA_START=116 /DNA_END=3475 /DNA_ORIENTATION=+